MLKFHKYETKVKNKEDEEPVGLPVVVCDEYMILLLKTRVGKKNGTKKVLVSAMRLLKCEHQSATMRSLLASPTVTCSSIFSQRKMIGADALTSGRRY